MAGISGTVLDFLQFWLDSALSHIIQTGEVLRNNQMSTLLKCQHLTFLQLPSRHVFLEWAQTERNGCLRAVDPYLWPCVWYQSRQLLHPLQQTHTAGWARTLQSPEPRGNSAGRHAVTHFSMWRVGGKCVGVGFPWNSHAGNCGRFRAPRQQGAGINFMLGVWWKLRLCQCFCGKARVIWSWILITAADKKSHFFFQNSKELTWRERLNFKFYRNARIP